MLVKEKKRESTINGRRDKEEDLKLSENTDGGGGDV